MALLNCAVDFPSSTKTFRHNSLLIFECYEYCGVFSRERNR
ncbi:hypothetical protein FOTG_19234 [Fusarium oxysporum f. sp. vasinfectum 25433]|uniref:Uncharacterized protein n=1 Tax=Fusarium oxysporum f. sp. vasinfectum 25433 TaxID=1089449 RepID=X0LUR2_FUSOX|nr:hypothetical protein FOTG_19234 [Fusarium oxysporum f. sp. vasinfectum 25433]